MRISDWSSDVCSSDLGAERAGRPTRSLVAGKYLRAKARALRSSGPRGGSSSQVQHMVDLSRARDRLDRGGGTGQAYSCFKSPRSEEHTSELQSLMRISYAVLCLKKKKKKQ